jgi:hypothetical protein
MTRIATKQHALNLIKRLTLINRTRVQAANPPNLLCAAMRKIDLAALPAEDNQFVIAARQRVFRVPVSEKRSRDEVMTIVSSHKERSLPT